MNFKRLYHSIRFFSIFDQHNRAEYAKRHRLFHHIGDNVRLPAMLVPLHSEMISIHNNVEVASGVKFVVHDAIHGVLNMKYNGALVGDFDEKLECIEIMDNVFVGANSVILGGVRIGSNVIIGSNTLVNKDIPDGTVWGGIPARQLGKFDELVSKRRFVKCPKDEAEAWAMFNEKH